MHMDLSPEDEAFRAEVRTFLSTTLTDDLRAASLDGLGADREKVSQWHRILFEKGWAAPDWPEEYGGTGWSPARKHIFNQELVLAGAPILQPFGLSMCGPVIYTFGSQEQKDRHLPPILDGSVWWCQGYSEPGSGSDLASLKTAAVRQGDEYIVNGQKIWTTNAHKADWIFCLVRTDNTGKPQTGISFLLIDMRTPGVEVRPLIALDGVNHFNEVYFTDVRVPAENLVGEENMGWTYAKYLLGHERMGTANVAASKRAVAALWNIARNEPGDDGEPLSMDPDFTARLSETEVKLMALEMTEARCLSELMAGNHPGDAASMLKILGTEVTQSLEMLRVEAVAHYALPFLPESTMPGSNEAPIGPDHAMRGMMRFLYGRAHSIYGGTNEVQRNVIAKGVLDL